MAKPLTSGSGTTAHPDGFHILAELVSAEGLTSPIKASGRIKYTCIGVSKNYIGLGASSGSLYVFHRNTFKYLQVFSNTEGALTKVVFAPNDNMVGIATSQGVIITWELNIDRRVKSERLAMSSAHRNGVVTAMIWDTTSERLFSGDNHGRITFVNVYHRKMSGLFKLPTELVMDADSAIVQLDYCDDKLLASTTTKCFICDTKKKQAYAVGTKLRDGQFGACFLQKATKEFPLVYSARPSSRIWEGNIVGQVLATHQFKHLLTVPSLPVVGPGRSPIFPGADHTQKSQSLNFAQLLTFGHGHNLLLTWTTRAIYVFDPTHIKVMVWSMDFKDILWACVYKSRVYCLHPNSQVRCYTLLSAERCISRLFALSLWEQCAQAAVYFAERVKQGNARRYVPRSLIQEVNYQLMDGNADVALMGKMEELLSNMEEDGLSTPGSSRRSSLESSEGFRLDSGIYMVRNRAGSDDSVEDFPIQKIRPNVVDQETQMDDGMEGYDAKDDGKSDSKVNQDNAVNFLDTLNQKVAALALCEPLEEEKESEYVDQEHNFELNYDKDVATLSSGRAQALPSFQEEAAQDKTEMESFEDFDEEVEVDDSFVMEEAEEIEGPGDLASGPAGINWGISQGKLGLRRQSSLLEEIAEALVKEGELDTSIAESLNSSSDDPVINTLTDPKTDGRGDSQSSQGKTETSSHGNQGGLTNQCKADLGGTSSHDATTSSMTSSNGSSSQFDHSGTDNEQNHAPDSGRPTSNANSLTTQDRYSQLGQVIPMEADLSLKSFRNNEDPCSDKPLRPHNLPLEPASDIDLKSSSFSEGTEHALEDWPVVRRSISMPTADHMTSPDVDGRRPRKQSYSKDKKRSKKSRIIDFDKPQSPSKADEPPKTDSAFAAAVTPKDPSKQQARNPPTSTPTKRSQSLTPDPTLPQSPTSVPSKRTSQPEIPPHIQMDFLRSSSFSTEPMGGLGTFNSSEEMFLGGPSMMFSMAGPKLAAQFFAPSFSAVKESLSSKLVKTKTFLKQMSEPEIGNLPVDHPVTTETQAEVLALNSPQSPCKDPTSPQHSPPKDTLQRGLSHSFESEPSLSRSSLPKVTSVELQTSSNKPFDPEKEKVEYCNGLPDDAVVKKLALATWDTKHSLQDPKLSLSNRNCRDILEKWLHVLQNALASKNHHLQTESFEEAQETMPVDQQTGDQKEVTFHLESSGEDQSAPSVGEECPVLSNHSLTNKDLQVDKINEFERDALSLPVKSRSKSDSQLSDPFCLPAPVLEDVSKLAMLCFEMAVFDSDAIVQSDSPSDTERSGSYQDESSSPETDQSHPFLDPNMNTLHDNTSVTQSVIGSLHPNPNSPKFTDQSNALSHNAAQHNVPDCSSQGCVSMETEGIKLEEQDQKSANFVTSFFFLVDVERVREILKWRDGWRKLTMAAILDCLQARERKNETEIESISRLVQVIEDDTHRGKPANISHINRLIQHGQIETALDVMLGAFPDLVPWEVLHLTQADTAPPGCFLDYASALLESVEAMDRDTMLASICSDLEVKCHLLTSTLSQGAPAKAELFCTCGNMPRPGSHVLVWQYGTLTDQILSLPGTGRDRLLSVCIQHGYWPGVLRLYLQLHQRGQALKMAVQLADMKLLSKEGILPMNMDEWILLLNLMSQSQSVSNTIQCLSCNAMLLVKHNNHWLTTLATSQTSSDEVCDWSTQDSSSKPECDWGIDCKDSNQDGIKLPSDWLPSVTWESIGKLLVKSVGPGLATRMLTDTCIPCGELSKEFYKNCVLVGMLEKNEGNVCWSMLEGIDTYLWSKRNNTMAPSIYHQVLQERAQAMNNDGSGSETFNSKVPKPDAVSKSSCLFIEDNDCHWGTNVKLNSDCELCGLALSATVSARKSGLLAFPCGHTFHSACVVERACLLCYELKCQSL
ncbi:uncharacterized protein LOC119723629 isoform X2 [Patiria miniata]|uniref:RING-type domain-containing protein n=1 Tax=Patiria miniata TaxID=46514 RepID=A0A913ZFV0_PATMI|nr:uncharacterized protein LOC119723629 isoform X2 [Patiria miniata]